MGPLNNVTAVAFDPAHNSVIWYDRTTGAINRANVNGTARTKLASVPSFSIPRSFAYDWQGGQVFLVDQLEFQIDMYAVNGISGVILNQNIYEGDMALNEPSVIAVNSKMRWVALVFTIANLSCVVLILTELLHSLLALMCPGFFV